MSDNPLPLLTSMTGFGRSGGVCGGRAWSWELRTVNHRGLDVRLKLPPGFEGREAGWRTALGGVLKRGAVQALLSYGAVERPGVTIRAEVLEALMQAAMALSDRIPGALPPRAEALLALPGVLRAGTEEALPDASAEAAVTAGLAAALAELVASRRAEGRRLGAVLGAQVEEIGALAGRARIEAGTQHVAQQARLQESLRSLLGDGVAVDPGRLAQEVALLASRADVREELDRLDSHLAEARRLLADGEAVGRRLDFLVQEFNREANTLCAKSATAGLTAIGLALKSAIEQVREQVQNIE